MATTLPGTMATTESDTFTARGVPTLMLMLMLRLRLMLKLTMLCMATIPPGTMATTALATSMAREALMLMLMLRPRLRLMLRPTTPSITASPGRNRVSDGKTHYAWQKSYTVAKVMVYGFCHVMAFSIVPWQNPWMQ